MASCIIDNIRELIGQAGEIIDSIKSSSSQSHKTIVMFDLVGSTQMKINKGHDYAMKKLLEHNQICRKFVTHFSGITIKELGDGILAQFDDAEKACLCAINFIEGISSLDVETKIAISTGKLESLQIENKPDVFGAVVDFCSRMEKFAFPNQILIDITTHNEVQSFLKNYADLQISNPMNAVLKGHTGKKELFEISHNSREIKNLLNIPFQVNQAGRLPIDEKVSFILNANHDVLEIGIRLREFTSYFSSRNPEEFKNFVLGLLKKGVNLRCFALDSDWALKNLPILDNEKKYYQEIPYTLNDLLTFSEEATKMNLPGSVQVFTYQHIPLFHVQCTDGDSPEGRMTVSNYLYGIKRSQCPIIQFSKESEPTMFSTYWESVQNIVKTSKPWNG